MMRVATVKLTKGAKVVDSAVVLTSAQIKAIGAVATCRYYCPDSGGKRTWKCLTPAEIAELHAGGVGVIPNWEWSATRPLSGAAAGLVDGVTFLGQLVADGVPAAALVMVSCDMNATPANRVPIEGYFRAMLGVLRNAGYVNYGVYGDTDLFAWLADLDPRPVGWLAAAGSWSSGTAGAQIRQRLQGAWGAPGGVPVSLYDPNDVLADVAGVWLPHDEPDPPKPKPVEDDDVKYSILVAPDRNPALVAIDGAGVTMIGLPGDDIAKVATVYDAQQITVSNELWDDVQKHSQPATAAPVTVEFPKPPTYTVTATVAPEAG